MNIPFFPTYGRIPVSFFKDVSVLTYFLFHITLFPPSPLLPSPFLSCLLFLIYNRKQTNSEEKKKINISQKKIIYVSFMYIALQFTANEINIRYNFCFSACSSLLTALRSCMQNLVLPFIPPTSILGLHSSHGCNRCESLVKIGITMALCRTF